MSRGSDALKRLIDIVGSSVALLVLAPVMAAVASAIAVKMGRPVFFKQLRPGIHHKSFTMLKFRTMSNAVDKSGQLLGDGERLTRLGKFLRATSLDELPEFWNVFKGEMSLVGPRPLLFLYIDRYTPEQDRRHSVRPGVTGWAQVNGRNAISWEKRFELDVWYVDNRSFLLDLRIMVLTVVRVLQRHNINADGSPTMSEFVGLSDQHLQSAPKGNRGGTSNSRQQP